MILRIVCLLLAARLGVAAVPTPESYFGHPIGADRTVMDWDKVVGYFQVLAKGSGRIRVDELGKTVEGRPFLGVTIAEAATLKDLDHYRQIQQRLADLHNTRTTE